MMSVGRDRGRSRADSSVVDRTRMRTMTREEPPPPMLAKGLSAAQVEAQQLGAAAAGKPVPAAPAAKREGDSCAFCSKAIPYGSPFCPLAAEVERELTGPKLHPECWDPYFDDTETSRCEWCCLPCGAKVNERKDWHGGSQAAGRAPLAGVPHGGAAGPMDLGAGRRVLHQACIEPYNKARGVRCAHCGQTVTVGKRVDGYGLVHNGFCFDQLMLRLKREEKVQLESLKKAEAEDFTCAKCKQLILPDDEYYPLDDDSTGGVVRKVHVDCWEGTTHYCVHCNGAIGFDTEFYEVPQEGKNSGEEESADDAPSAGMVHIGCWDAWVKKSSPLCAHCGEHVMGEHCIESSTYEGHSKDYILHVDCFQPWKEMERAQLKEQAAAAEADGNMREERSLSIVGTWWGDVKEGEEDDDDDEEDSEAPDKGAAAAVPSAGVDTSFGMAKMLEEAANAALAIHEVESKREAVDVSDGRSSGVVVLGWMWKRGQRYRSWKRRWAILKECELCYYSGCTEGSSLKGSVSLANDWPDPGKVARLVEIRQTPHGVGCGIEIIDGKRTFIGYPEVKVHANGNVTVGTTDKGGKVVAPSHLEVTPWIKMINETAQAQRGMARAGGGGKGGDDDD